MRVVHCKREPYTHYIGRPGPLGNQYRIGYDGNREQVILFFEDLARKSALLQRLIKELPEDAVLGCWCAPQSCHGDVIVKLWKELHIGL